LVYAVIDWLGFAVCHQLPERSLSYGSRVLAICARDTGIYLGLLVGVLVLCLLNRRREYGFPPWYVFVYGLFGLGLMALDGFSSYGGFRTTTNDIRLITGLLAGSAIALVVVPLFNYQAWKNGVNERTIKGPRELLIYAATTLAVFLFLQYRPGWLFWPMFILTGGAIIFAFVYVNMILVMLVPWWTQKAERLRDLAVPILIGAILGYIELAASYWMHAYLLSKITGG